MIAPQNYIFGGQYINSPMLISNADCDCSRMLTSSSGFYPHMNLNGIPYYNTRKILILRARNTMS